MWRVLRIVILAAAGCGLAAASPAAEPAEQIEWQSDLETALRQARELNRPLLVHFWTPECIPCRRLEQNVFNQPRVVEAMQDFFVPVKVNANEHPELAARYRINSVPKDVVLTPDNVELHRLFTPQDPEQYVAQLSAVAFRTGTTTNTVASSHSSDLPTADGRTDSRGDDRRGAATPEQFLSRHTSTSANRDSTALESRSVEAAAPTEVINRFARRNTVEADTTTAQANSEPTRPTPTPLVARRGDRLAQDSAAQDSAAEHSTAGQGKSRWGTWPADADMAADDVAAAEDVETRPTLPVAESPSNQPAAEPSVRREPVAAGRPAATTAPPLGMDGYCPVTLLRSEKWVKGDPRFGVIHRGRVYLFTGEDEKNIFFADPDEYSPVLAGIDPVQLNTVGEAIEGNRAHGVVYRKRVYLFSSEDNLEQFWKDPERYASPIRQAMESGDVNRLFR